MQKYLSRRVVQIATLGMVVLVLGACGGGGGGTAVAADPSVPTEIVCSLPQVLQDGVCVTPAPLVPALTGLTPVTAVIGAATTFTVTGTNLPNTAELSIAGGATCAPPIRVGNGANGFTQSCTPTGAAGTRSVTVLTQAGGTIIAAQTIAVSAAVPVCTLPQVLQGDSCLTPLPPFTGQLTDTGITSDQCYGVDSDSLISCTSAAAVALNNQQDGMVGYDATTPSAADGKLGFAYRLVGNHPITECVQDTITGLMWEGKPATGPRAGTLAFTSLGNNAANDTSGYIAAVNAAGLCGFNDWRLPTVFELESLVDYSIAAPSPMIDGAWFPNTMNSIYWSSVLYVGENSYAWGMPFGNGIQYNPRSSSFYVRLVR